MTEPSQPAERAAEPQVSAKQIEWEPQGATDWAVVTERVPVSVAPSPERSPIRQFLIDYWEGEDDNSMAHAMIFAPSDFEAVRRTVQAFAQQTDWLQQQCDERAVLRAKLQTAEAALESARQPLHAEMGRLNKRVIELTAELDRRGRT